MFVVLNIGAFIAFLLDDFDLGFAVLPNVVVFGLATMFAGVFIKQSWLTYCGAFLMGFYYLMGVIADMV